MATLPPNETLNLAPLILRTRELGKQDPKRAIAYAEVALEVLNAPQETGTKEPLASAASTTNSSEFTGEPDFASVVREEDMAAQDGAEIAYEHRVLDIQEKLETLSSAERKMMTPALIALNKYRSTDITHASEYAELLLDILNSQTEKEPQTGQNALTPPMEQLPASQAKELTFNDVLESEENIAQTLNFDVSSPEFWKESETPAQKRAAEQEKLREGEKLRQQKAEEKEFQEKIAEAKRKIEETDWEDATFETKVRLAKQDAANEEKKKKIDALPSLAPTEDLQPPKKGFFSGIANGFKKLFGRN